MQSIITQIKATFNAIMLHEIYEIAFSDTCLLIILANVQTTPSNKNIFKAGNIEIHKIFL